ncbi:MFS transporter [Halorhodospira halophila]|nr:MFS transporter [Halorhodospira halophila]
MRFVIENRRFLGFGLLAAALSGFGQTFFVSLFSEPIRTSFDLGHGGFGLYYGIATLGSAAAVVWLGRALDRFDLRAFAAATLIGLAVGAAVVGLAGHVAVLLLGLFLLRLCGQGLMTHMAFSSMARYFDARRGRALGLAALGLPVAEAALPGSAVVLLALLDWQQVWLLVAALLLLVGLPALLALLRGHSARRRRIERLADEQPAGTGWRRRDVLRDRRLWLYLPGVIAAPASVTFLFFHQVHLADARGWPLELMAASFLGFAAAHVVGLLFGGPWVDRITARRALPLALLPLLTGLVLAAGFTGPWVVPAYMLLAGLSAGVGAPAINALWAELYGIHNLGAIRALAHAAMSVATALSPPATGVLLDWGVPVGAVIGGLAGFVSLAGVAARLAFRL